MGNPRTPRPHLSVLVDVARSPDGRIDGQISTTTTGASHPFSGVLELLKVLEDLLDRDEASPATTPPDEGATP
jgi:hypothetical protein